LKSVVRFSGIGADNVLTWVCQALIARHMTIIFNVVHLLLTSNVNKI